MILFDCINWYRYFTKNLYSQPVGALDAAWFALGCYPSLCIKTCGRSWIAFAFLLHFDDGMLFGWHRANECIPNNLWWFEAISCFDGVIPDSLFLNYIACFVFIVPLWMGLSVFINYISNSFQLCCVPQNGNWLKRPRSYLQLHIALQCDHCIIRTDAFS